MPYPGKQGLAVPIPTLRSVARTLLICLVLPIAHAQTEMKSYVNYLVKDISFIDEARETQFAGAFTHIHNEAYAEADDALQAFLELHEQPMKEENPVAYAEVLTNLGIVKALQNRVEEAHAALNQSIRTFEAAEGPFTQRLIEPVMTKALIHASQDMYIEAEDLLRRVQHVIHRNAGVYSPRQVPVIDRITGIKIQKGEMIEADRAQKFKLKIHEHTYSRDSEKMIRALQEIGTYFAHRGNMLPAQSWQSPERGQYRNQLFDEAISLYEEAIQITEEKYGKNDLRVIEPLRGLARARLLQVTGRRHAEDALERVVQIVEEHPGTDLTDKVRALVDLADAYLITDDARAEETYMTAWDLMADRPELSDLGNQLFGTPERLYPRSPGVIVLDRRPFNTEEGEDLYVDAEYTVTANGRVSDVNVVDGNVPNAEKRSVRNYLIHARFRPRVVDGEFQDTTGLMLHQPFIVEKKDPVNDVTISVDTGP
ncbi:MAG: tetratricopeptide repeat protein [Pseudomonadales bacterium]